NEQWGYINKKGKYVINPQFGGAAPFDADGLAIVRAGNKIGIINKKGDYVINPQFDSVSIGAADQILDAGKSVDSYFADGLLAVESGGKWGFVNKKGEYVINPQYDYAEAFSDGLAVVKSGDKYGYINKKGKYVITPQFDKAVSFCNGIAAVGVEDGEDDYGYAAYKFGFINKKGKYIEVEFNAYDKKIIISDNLSHDKLKADFAKITDEDIEYGPVLGLNRISIKRS
ncbi:MAG: WG repeat-containing protein, partial [Clostridia bacterium]|nr:WG repeat-containing protein [Clostridia bacterium]